MGVRYSQDVLKLDSRDMSSIASNSDCLMIFKSSLFVCNVLYLAIIISSSAVQLSAPPRVYLTYASSLLFFL